MQTPARAGGVSHDAPSLGQKLTTTLVIFHFLSLLLRLSSKLPVASVQYGEWGPVFLCE